MEDKYKEYLAARVLQESKPVTYRLLSRALTVHVNIAKQMLYDFYTNQNEKKPNSVHATYLLTGRKRSSEHTNGVNGKDGDDEVMQSSPFMSSMPNPESQKPAEAPVPKTSVVLVREEELGSIKAEFEEITSIHIYSLEPSPIENLNILAVCNQEVAASYSSEDPLDWWRLYGSIHNPYIKRRTTKYAPPAAPAPAKPAPKIEPKAKASEPTKEKTAAPAKEKTSAPARKGGASEGNTSGRSTPQPSTTASSLKKSDSKPNLKREKSDIFKSFAKAKAKPKSAATSKDSTPAPAEDVPMQGMSEDEGDDDEPEVKIDEAKEKEAREARAKRQEELRKMMEESDEEMPDAAVKDDQEATHAQHAAHGQLPPVDTTATETAPPAPTGRRRGRRRVTKTKKVQDEDGYLVTKEEQVWESFSEDEPPPKKPKPAPKPAPAAKGKKLGQGSIASFFKKG